MDVCTVHGIHPFSGIANREESYALCDQMTRASGRLTKLVIIQDLRGFSFGTAMRFSKLQAHFHSSRILHSSLTPLPLRQGNLSKLSEFLYPQLVATVVIAHPPQLIHRLHSLLKVHLPCVLAHLLYELGLLCAAGHLQEAAGQDEACSDVSSISLIVPQTSHCLACRLQAPRRRCRVGGPETMPTHLSGRRFPMDCGHLAKHSLMSRRHSW